MNQDNTQEIVGTPTLHSISCETNWGNVDYKATCMVDLATLITLGGLGLLQVLQRSPSGNADKVIAGYKKRPADFKRTNLPYNEANVALLVECLNAAKVDVPTGEGDKVKEIALLPVISDTAQHDFTVAEVKFDDQRAAYVKAKDRLADVASKVGYVGELGDGTLDGAPTDFLRAIKRWQVAQDL